MATIHRVVENQEKVATLSLVNTIEEQGVLEELLEASKPQKPDGYDNLHYLLITPFRYPPLKYGSRFGARFEPSLFYGALNVSTALAETAYYRFVYLSGMKEPYTQPILMDFSSYTVAMRTKKGVFLDKKPFDQFAETISSPTQYEATQALGAAMRKADVEAVQYISARDPRQGKNLALYTPKALQSKKPITTHRWIASVTNDEIGFIAHDSDKRISFDKQIFLVDGELPAPSC